MHTPTTPCRRPAARSAAVCLAALAATAAQVAPRVAWAQDAPNLDERARELAGASMRWFDLVRIDRTSGTFPRNPGY